MRVFEVEAMKKLLILLMALSFIIAAAVAEPAVTDEPDNVAVPEVSVQSAEEPEAAEPEAAEESEPGRLDGIIIGIDPGHQAKANYDKEAVAPDSKETKAKVSSGTQGVSTRKPEYEVNLEVSLMLKKALEAEGAQVVMTRETHDVDISNQERAIMCNEAGCHLVLRIHCNGSEKKSVNGIGLYVRATGACAEESYAAAEYILPAMAAATGAKAQGIYKRDTYTGLNWSEVPCILVEMGYMTNPEEDEKLCDAEYQQLLVTGMTEGVCAYFGPVEETEESDDWGE